ncbi:PleD family two-component system response regulator [Candidatus Omnitrophota bacterium]
MWKKKILIIDDEKEFVKMVQYRLEANGYQVLTANDGERGLELAKKNPDLILLDVMMPTLSGIEVCQLLKEDPQLKDIPVIFLTAKRTKEDQLKGLTAGAEEYIAKPFYSDELLEKIKKTLEEKNK